MGWVVYVWVRNECSVKESIISKYENGVLRWFGNVERMGDARIAKQVLNGSVEGVRGKGRPIGCLLINA
jgi:hypothetical protein